MQAMPNYWGRIEIEASRAMCHDPQRIQGFTAFGANPYRGNFPLPANQEMQWGDASGALRASSKRRPSTPHEFLAYHRNRLQQQQANKATDAASWQDVDRLSAGIKANCAAAIVPGGVGGPLAGTSWATWDGIARKNPPQPPEPEQEPPTEKYLGSFMEVSAAANCAPAILAVPKDGVGTWAGSSPQTIQDHLHRMTRPQSAGSITGPRSQPGGHPAAWRPSSAVKRPTSATMGQRPSSAARLQRPSSAVSLRPSSAVRPPSAMAKRPSSAAQLHQGYATAAGGRPRPGQEQELFGAVLLNKPQSGESAWN